MLCFLFLAICRSSCCLRIIICMCTESVIPLLRFFKIFFSSAFVIQIPLCPGGCYLSFFPDSWSGVVMFCALDLGYAVSLISLMGYILLGCCRVLPSACLFTGSLEFIHKCGLLFFSMGIIPFFPLLYFYCPCICKQSFHNFLFFLPSYCMFIHSDVKKI